MAKQLYYGWVPDELFSKFFAGRMKSLGASDIKQEDIPHFASPIPSGNIQVWALEGILITCDVRNFVPRYGSSPYLQLSVARILLKVPDDIADKIGEERIMQVKNKVSDAMRPLIPNMPVTYTEPYF